MTVEVVGSWGTLSCEEKLSFWCRERTRRRGSNEELGREREREEEQEEEGQLIIVQTRRLSEKGGQAKSMAAH